MPARKSFLPSGGSPSSAKGGQAVHVDLTTSRRGKAALLALLPGPTGGLRAPTLRVGRTLLVGFNAEAYAKALR